MLYLMNSKEPADIELEYVEENWLTRPPDTGALFTTLITTGTVIFMSLLYWNDVLNLAEYFIVSRENIFSHHEYWRLWTSLFIHADPKHLLSNLFLFFILGYFLSGYFNLTVFPVMAFVLGGLTNFIVLMNMPENSNLLGLSGVVFWMGGVWLTLYFFIEHRKGLLQKISRTIGIALILFMPSEAFDPHISYLAHAWGFLFGIIFGTFFFIYNRKMFRSAELRRLIPLKR